MLAGLESASRMNGCSMMKNKFSVFSRGGALQAWTIGFGPPLLLIHGSCVDSSFFIHTADYLSLHFRLIGYDRFGYGESQQAPDENYSIAAQAEDAANIIRTIGSPCYILAHSAGTTIAMELAAAYPELVKQMLLFEPPIMDCLSERSPILNMIRGISTLIAQGKYIRASNRFLLWMCGQDEPERTIIPEEQIFSKRNTACFIQHEFDAVFFYFPDYQKLKRIKVYIGLSSFNADNDIGLITEILTKRLNGDLVRFPGRHNCPRDLAGQFSDRICTLFLTGNRN